jgi:hypothetical protein
VEATIGAVIPDTSPANTVRVSTGARVGRVVMSILVPLAMIGATGAGISTGEIAGLKVDVQNVMNVMIEATVGRKVPVPKAASEAVPGSR